MYFTKIMMSVLLVFLILSGCSSKKRVVAVEKPLPSWYLHPMQSTSDTLYSVAQGENKADAIANALNEILSTLSISISSEFNIKSVVKEGQVQSVQSTSLSDIKTRVEQIRINNYQVINARDFSFERYLVQVKMDKRSLFKSLEQDLNTKIRVLEDNNKEARNYYAIKELGVYKKSLNSLANIHSTLAVMRSLNPNFDDAIYTEKLQNAQKKYDKLLSKISFSINSNNDAKNLRASIAKGLSANTYKINNHKDKKHFNIYMSSKTQKAKSYGFDLARSAISITVKDYKGTIVGSNKLNITGQSTQGYKIAKENIALKLNIKIAKEGIANIIGLEI